MHRVEQVFDRLTVAGVEMMLWNLDRNGMFLPNVTHVERALHDDLPR